MPVEQYNTPIEKLDLSSRTLNCLKRGNLNKVGQVLEVEKSELLKLRNFGEKSLNALFQKLEDFGFLANKDENVNLDEDELDVSTVGES